jgi:uncharacterized protein (DUF2141 family)
MKERFMIIRKKISGKRLLLPLYLFTLLLFAACARMGSPDGGWYDDTPPRVVNSTPDNRGVNVKTNKITINFSEYIKLEDAQNKVIISPPQVEMPEIKASGRRIIVDLKDTLKENTTYTVDFGDAISDNNEGNPMGNYTFSFSTGDHIDTLEVSGYCLNAQNLEPIKGLMVGLYNDFADSLFHKQPMMRVSRTNGSGYFSIKGVAPGTYRCFALQDNDGDLVFGQKSEIIGFNHDSIKPTWKMDARPDTLWLDSLHIKDIVSMPYIHFLPDDVTLLCFQEPQTDRFLLKTERNTPERIGMYFTYGSDSLPRLRGLNFDEKDAFILEASQKNDTLTYWLADTTLVNQDTLEIEATYLMTDSLGALVSHTDTIAFSAKVSYAKRMKAKQKEFEEWQKEQEKKKKHKEPYDSIMPVDPLRIKLSSNGFLDPNQRLYFETPEPLSRCDTAAIHLSMMVDSVWTDHPITLRQVAVRRYELAADWAIGQEYKLEIDSATFQGLYGAISHRTKQNIKVRTEDDYSSLVMELSGVSLTDSIVVQLMDTGDKPVRQTLADADGVAEFAYLKPGTYYVRAYIDLNGNGQWDTGVYDQDLQPEPVYYFHEKLDCRQKWDVSRKWNLTARPRYNQKPTAITKQKPDKQKQQLKSRNLQRARDLGKEYIPKGL